MVKLNNMTQKEIKNAINKQVYEFAATLGYEMSDDGDGSTVTFVKPGCSTADETIDYGRSSHQTCTYNWAPEWVKEDARRIDEFAEQVVRSFNV